jgi:ABC-type multidrug transport system fused ATPase/permease subunit
MKQMLIRIRDDVFGYHSSRKNKFIRSWSILFFAIVIVLMAIGVILFLDWGPMPDKGHYYHYTLALLVIVVHLIVLFNTGVYMRQSYKIAKELPGNKPEKFGTVFFGFYSITLFLSGILIYIFTKAVIHKESNEEWYNLYHLNEWFSSLIFLLFLIMDIYFYMTLSSINGSTRDLDQEKSFIIKQIGFIGVPGFTCIFVILLISRLFQWSGIFEVEGVAANGNFIEGFSAGAIAMHIFFTQIVFTVLTTNKNYKP